MAVPIDLNKKLDGQILAFHTTFTEQKMRNQWFFSNNRTSQMFWITISFSIKMTGFWAFEGFDIWGFEESA